MKDEEIKEELAKMVRGDQKALVPNELRTDYDKASATLKMVSDRIKGN